MFLIAGVSPKTKTLDRHPRRCPRCGLHQAYNKRIDHYFNLFFIPLIRVKKGESFLMCERCEQTVHEVDSNDDSLSKKPDNRCDQCGRVVEKDFAYCPYCGRQQ